MLPIDILIKAITLLYRENELEIPPEENSNDLVKNILNAMDNSTMSKLHGGESEIILNLKYLVKDIINNPENYDKNSLLQSLELITKDKPTLLRTINKSINVELSVGGMKKSIVSLRNTLFNYRNEEEIKTIISKISYKIRTNNMGDSNIKDIASNLVSNIEALLMTSKAKDPGIMDEIDLDDGDDATEKLDKIKGGEGGLNHRYLSGWKELNKMTQGGFKRGEMFMNDALQHNYKSGFIRSIFMQLARCNKPVALDPTKKPLLLFVSFEDDIDIMIEFMYVYIYYNENKTLPDMSSLTNKEVVAYIKKDLTKNGFHIKILRVNPSEWTYKHFFNKILSYEAEGFEIHACLNDYLSKLPTTGCVTSGPMGTDLRDLYNRFRNFMSSKRILFGTPHQLSTEAKQLIRNGVVPQEFVKEISGKGYTEGSRQLDQVVDLEIYQHIARIKRIPYLTLARGKHRIPTIIDEEDKYCRLAFPKGAPIPENLNDEDEKENKTDDSTEFDF